MRTRCCPVMVADWLTARGLIQALLGKLSAIQERPSLRELGKSPVFQRSPLSREFAELRAALRAGGQSGQPKATQRAHIAELILILAHPLHRNPIASLWRNLEPLGRLLNGFLFGGGINSAEMFSALADDIDAPAGH